MDKSKWINLFSKEPEVTTTSTHFGVTTSCKYIIDKKDIKNNTNVLLEEVRTLNNLVIKDENELYIRELCNRINKAIEYLDSLTLQRVVYDTLREILKGENNE